MACKKKGEKKDETQVITDKLGENVTVDKCPVCDEHPDCFACVYGRCTALKESGGQRCVFYKPAAVTEEQNKQIYKKLCQERKTDLINKYIKAYLALGLFDEEIEAAEEFRFEMEVFAAEDFKRQLATARAEGLFDE